MFLNTLIFFLTCAKLNKCSLSKSVAAKLNVEFQMFILTLTQKLPDFSLVSHNRLLQSLKTNSLSCFHIMQPFAGIYNVSHY